MRASCKHTLWTSGAFSGHSGCSVGPNATRQSESAQDAQVYSHTCVVQNRHRRTFSATTPNRTGALREASHCGAMRAPGGSAVDDLNSHVVGGFHRAVVEEILVAPLRVLVVLFERVVPNEARKGRMRQAADILQLRTIATRVCRGGVEWPQWSAMPSGATGASQRARKCCRVLPSKRRACAGRLLSATAQCAVENRGSRRSKRQRFGEVR